MHGSNKNTSQRNRLGVAIRLVSNKATVDHLKMKKYLKSFKNKKKNLSFIKKNHINKIFTVQLLNAINVQILNMKNQDEFEVLENRI